jgi:8-oxo-dGTP diphosphatase
VAELPTFGRLIAGANYIVRPSAYALLRDHEGKFAVVLTPEGNFLPGGGMDAGETPEQAIVRECAEECGFVVRVGRSVGEAVQFAWSIKEQTYFEKRCAFFEAEIVGTAASTEVDHELVWLAPERAAKIMYHESHGWAIRRVLARP